MIVGMVRYLPKRGQVVAVVEWAAGVSSQEILRNWVASQGLTERAIKDFDLNGCSVIPWNGLKNTLVPYSEREKKHAVR